MKNSIIREGDLDLVGIKIPCYILEDGTRVLSSRATQNALKVGETSDRKEEEKAGGELARFLDQKWFKDMTNNKFDLEHFRPVICYKGNQKINGYEATVLVDICDVVLSARSEGVRMNDKQKRIADQCEILVRSFAKVGIIALVDEATGYQYEREQDALQLILKTLVSDEILDYQKQFQLSFYKEIFRLWGVPFTEKYIKNKPQFIGHLTNKYIYSNLPKGTFVLAKLKENTPKTTGGNWRYKLHQSLTKDEGREALKKVLYTAEAFASISKDKGHFDRLMRGKFGPQQELPFPDDPDDTPPKNPTPPKKPSPLSDFNQKITKALEYNPKKD